MIRKFESSDICHVVAVHMASFPGFFLSFLGPKFLTIFYSRVCFAPESIAFVYLDKDGLPIGFVVGSLNPRGFYSRMLKRDWFKFTLSSVGPIIKNPTIILRLARAVLHPSSNQFGQNVAGLFSIGVLPDNHCLGIGKFLVNAFLNDARLRGCERVYLSTDRDNNESVNNFYIKNGFKINFQYTSREGRRMNQYCIEFNSD